jgi:hypothetical protein
LRPVSIGEARLAVCKSCLRVAVLQSSVSPLLETTATHLSGHSRAVVKVSRAAPVSLEAKCPRCNQQMSKDDYCSAGIVAFCRCDRCHLLWLTAEQLALMSVMWADMNRKIELAHAVNEQRLRDVTLFVDQVLAARAVSDMLAGAAAFGI